MILLRWFFFSEFGCIYVNIVLHVYAMYMKIEKPKYGFVNDAK